MKKNKIMKLVSASLAVVMALSVFGEYTPIQAATVQQEQGIMKEVTPAEPIMAGATNESFGATLTNVGPNTKGYQSASLEGATIVDASKYKEIDYSFLENFSFGETGEYDFLAVYDNVAELQESTDYRLRENVYLKTKGYYEAGDKGGAVYLVQTKKETGSILLSNGLYANIVPDQITLKDEKYAVVSMRQMGAKADGETPAQICFANAIGAASNYAKSHEEIDRGLAYIPAGEYKVTNIMSANATNTSIVGAGQDKAVFFTDNDYRKTEGYSEHLMESWNSENLYFEGFKLEAREVDLYHYMRQFSLFYCKNIYIYQLSLVVPEGAYRAYQYQDKQYSNMCCYCGNTGVTIDDCYMEQMSGTYRGANLGILDIWSAGENNITVMNCKMVGNARDEQIGFFSTDKDSAAVKNVDFINNEVICYRPKYYDVVGTATMRFTIAYADSKNIEDIRIEGNHFKVECDSKFMTFGTLKNCDVSHNVIEVYTAQNNGAAIFDSSCGDGTQVKIHDNEFYLSSYNNSSRYCGLGGGGSLTFYNNRVFTDISLSLGLLGSFRNCEIVAFGNYGGGSLSVTTVTPKSDIVNNKFLCFNGFGSNPVFGCGSATDDMHFDNNVIYNYKRNVFGIGSWEALGMINSDANRISFTHNEIYAPNTYVTHNYSSGEKDEAGNFLQRIFYFRSGTVKTLDISKNIFQGYKGLVRYTGKVEGYEKSDYVFDDNQYDGITEKLEDVTASQIDVLYQGKACTDITTDQASIDLDTVVYIPTEYDEEGNVTKQEVATDREVKWYSAIESIATVSDDGIVTKHQNGDVTLMATTLDGTTSFGKVKIHFEDAVASSLTTDVSEIEMQTGLRRYFTANVMPETASKQVIWESSDAEVVSINAYGLANANKAGEAIITCRTTDGSGLKAQIHVTVIEPLVRVVNLATTAKTFKYSEIGKKLELKPSTGPENATNHGISKCVSSNEAVATVDDKGVVTVTGPGVCSIKVYALDESIYKGCTIYVTPNKIETINQAITNSTVELSWKAETGASGYKVYQYNEDSKEYVEKQDIGKSTSYKATGLSAKTTYKYKIIPYIYVGWKNYIYAEADEVSVTTFEAETITSFSNETLVSEFSVGDTKEKTVKYNPSTLKKTIEDFEYSIEDTKVAKLEAAEMNGSGVKFKITAVAPGVTNLILKSKDERGQSTKLPIAVFGNSIDSESIKLTTTYKHVELEFEGMEDESNITGYLVKRRKGSPGYPFRDVDYVEKNESKKYKVIDLQAPTDALEYCYTVCPAIKVDDKTIYYGKGCSTKAGEKVEYSEITEFTTDKKEIAMICGNQETVNAFIEPENATYQSVYWTTDDKAIATVEGVAENSKTAKITALKVGVTKIKATTMDGNYTEAVIDVIVTPKKPSIESVNVGSECTILTWNKVDGANGYKVYRKNGDIYEEISDVESTTFVDKNLKADSLYLYKLVPYMLVGQTKYEGEALNDIVAMTSTDKLPVKATGYHGIYDKTSHQALTIEGVCDGKLEYSINGVDWSEEIPEIKYVKDSCQVYIKYTKELQICYGIVEAIIEKADRPEGYPAGKLILEAESECFDVSSLALPENYQWSEESAAKTFTYAETIKAVANYVGEDVQNYETTSFEIEIFHEANEMKHAKLILNKKSFTYTSKAIAPAVTVTYGKKTLVPNVDYKVTYTNHINPGVAMVTMEGVKERGFMGSISAKFEIKASGSCGKNAKWKYDIKKKTLTIYGKGAMKNFKKASEQPWYPFAGGITRVVVEKNMTGIGSNAFYNCKKVKSIQVKTSKLKKVGKNALKGVHKKAVIRVPKKKLQLYKNKLFKKKGQSSTVKIKRN